MSAIASETTARAAVEAATFAVGLMLVSIATLPPFWFMAG
jgi:hypothetical protein